MSTLNEKAGTFILTAVQVMSDVKKIVEERVKTLVKDAMSGYDGELSNIRERLGAVEKAIHAQPMAKEKVKASKQRRRTAKARPRKKPTAQRTETVHEVTKATEPVTETPAEDNSGT